MKFIADMGVSQSTVEWLRQRKFDVLHVRELGMQRSSDSHILEVAKRENRVVLTFDLDFGTLMAASHANLPSVILFRLKDETPFNVNNRLGSVLNTAAESLQNGAIIIIEQRKYRVRRLPIQ